MVDKALRRTDYWNRVTGGVRTGDTRRDETVVDIETFLLPYGQLAIASLHLWGVAHGLSVTATPQQPGLTVKSGAAVDVNGRVIVLRTDAMAVVDAGIDPADPTNIPTVPVGADGVVMPTDNRSGTCYLTIRHQEVQFEGLGGNAPTLAHAPWLRLVDTGGFADDGTDVVLARVGLTNGVVTDLTGELRRQCGVRADRLQLRSASAAALGAATTVGDILAAELVARPDGAIELTLPDAPPSKPALHVDITGNVGVGVPHPQRSLHVEGSEIHSGGSSGGFSFADRSTASFVESPAVGERWVWYAKDGVARLRSGENDLLQIGTAASQQQGIGLDVARRMRVRKGNDDSAGIWFNQNTPDPGAAFVGMAGDTRVGFFGAGGGWWGLTMDTTDGSVTITAKRGPFDPFGPTGLALTVAGTTTLQRHTTMWDGITVNPPRDWMGNPTAAAATFDGDVRVTRLIKSGGSFQIDHPLDPANKYLSQLAGRVTRHAQRLLRCRRHRRRRPGADHPAGLLRGSQPGLHLPTDLHRHGGAGPGGRRDRRERVRRRDRRTADQSVLAGDRDPAGCVGQRQPHRDRGGQARRPSRPLSAPRRTRRAA